MTCPIPILTGESLSRGWRPRPASHGTGSFSSKMIKEAELFEPDIVLSCERWLPPFVNLRAAIPGNSDRQTLRDEVLRDLGFWVILIHPFL
jgi:hypothetical protein